MGVKTAESCLDSLHNNTQGVVYFMGHTCGQLADGGHLFTLDCLGLGLFDSPRLSYAMTDCDLDGIDDSTQLEEERSFTNLSFNPEDLEFDGVEGTPEVDGFSGGVPAPPANSDVTLLMDTNSAGWIDTTDPNEYILVYVNNTYVGNVYEQATNDTLIVAMDTWNTLRAGRTSVKITFEFSANTTYYFNSPYLNGGLTVSYMMDRDLNDNGWLEFQNLREGETTVQAVFRVSLSHVWDQEVSVAFATADGTAEAGTDYLSNSGVAIVAVGSLVETVVVDVSDTDSVPPAGERREACFLRGIGQFALLITPQAHGSPFASHQQVGPAVLIGVLSYIIGYLLWTTSVFLVARYGFQVTATWFTIAAVVGLAYAPQRMEEKLESIVDAVLLGLLGQQVAQDEHGPVVHREPGEAALKQVAVRDRQVEQGLHRPAFLLAGEGIGGDHRRASRPARRSAGRSL